MSHRGLEKGENDVNSNEFDNFMRELFEVEPPLGRSFITMILCYVLFKKRPHSKKTCVVGISKKLQ